MKDLPLYFLNAHQKNFQHDLMDIRNIIVTISMQKDTQLFVNFDYSLKFYNRTVLLKIIEKRRTEQK